jgi:hypothetical protein
MYTKYLGSILRECGDVYLENTFISSLLKRDHDHKVALNYKDDVVDTRVEKVFTR